MSEEHELEDVSREEAGAVLYRLADGVAVGAVQIGEETIAVPDRLDVEIEREIEEDERELEVELEWPLSAEDEVDVAPQEERDLEGEVPEGSTGEGGGADAAAVEDAPIEAPTEDELVGDEAGEVARQGADAAPDPTSVVEPGDVAESGSDARFELFEDSAGEWRWRLVHANGNIIADSGEGYSRKANAKKGLRSVMRNAPGASVVEE